jgi:hypothetical protein
LPYTAVEQTEFEKEVRMNIKEWDVTINQIVNESNLQPTDAGKHKILFGWRAQLEREPTSLQPFQIDEIVREVRKRIGR